MKLITLILIIHISSILPSLGQKFRQEQYPFPPQFQTPGSNIFSSENSLYLPPESHTPIPYFPMKNVNLQFPYLPPTGTKAPSAFPTPYPLIISTHLVHNFEDDDDDEETGRIRLPQQNQPIHQKNNSTSKSPQNQMNEKRDMRSIPNGYQHPIDRIDVKYPTPQKFGQSSMPTPEPNHAPVTRRMIINAETHRNDMGFDQMKAGALQSNPFIAAPGLAGVFVSSTTEPAIPIIRLSNEMDLDGSFSYEALGADQTHYVQHSRMENMGSEKEEQVVEGSYSYVGDNGQTYTVHYIADSNGFRASGDHLPVAPPVPEIIQRSIQYNLAEEAKRPPHLKSWQDDGRDNEIDNSERNNFALPPPRNLFTGRTPEAFSFNYPQGSNTQNNLAASPSNQVKTVDYSTEQPKAKPNNGPISPQITFLASQGAHVPSLNTIQNSISRMFNTEKPPLPQLVNYEAALKEAEQESNKALWRWQYGMQSNQMDQNQNKDTISRSFGQEDDVMINFSEMTPDQYTKMIRAQIEPSSESMNINQHLHNYQESSEDHQIANNYQNHNIDKNHNSNIKKTNYIINEEKQIKVSNQKPVTQESWYKTEEVQKYNNFNPTPKPDPVKQFIKNEDIKEITPKAKLITYQSFAPPSQIVTQAYDFDETNYEPRKIKAINLSTMRPVNLENVVRNNYEEIAAISNSMNNVGTELASVKVTTSTTLAPIPTFTSVGGLKFTDFIVKEDTTNPNEKQVIETTTPLVPREPEPTTTEGVRDIFEQNIFLKNLINSGTREQHSYTEQTQAPIRVLENTPKVETLPPPKTDAKPKTEQTLKFVQYHPKPTNDLKSFTKRKSLDINDVLNYVAMKNSFESNKVKSKSKPISETSNLEHKNEVRFIPIKQERIVEPTESKPASVRTLNLEQQEELRGMIKNYKVLQRNSNNVNTNKFDNSQLRRDLTPPPLPSPNLPPLGRAGPSMKSYLPPIYV